MSSNGDLTLVVGDSPSLPKGDLYLFNASLATVTELGSPNAAGVPTNIGGMTAGTVVAANAGGSRLYGYFHNSHGWFQLINPRLKARDSGSTEVD